MIIIIEFTIFVLLLLVSLFLVWFVQMNRIKVCDWPNESLIMNFYELC